MDILDVAFAMHRFNAPSIAEEALFQDERDRLCLKLCCELLPGHAASLLDILSKVSGSAGQGHPDCSHRVTTYQAGETITLSWRETIGHAGRWRVAFDEDGADLDDFNDDILLDIADPAGTEGNTGDGNLWEVQVTLPTAPCDNCTLQLVQMMDGDTSSPVADPTGRSSYYQCADIVIEDSETSETGDTHQAQDVIANDDEPPKAGIDAGAGSESTNCGCASTAPTLGLVWLMSLGIVRRKSSYRLLS